MDKKTARIKRAKRVRMKIAEIGDTRLSVHRSPRHIYVQVIAPSGDKVLACASTLDKEVIAQRGKANKTEAARIVGKLVAERAIKAGISNVAFDRSGFKYHGRVKALADAARESGLIF